MPAPGDVGSDRVVVDAPSGQHQAPLVWAIDTHWLEQALEWRLTPLERGLYCDKKTPEAFTQLFLNQHPKAFIGTATPMILNERLSVQQGVFLCPGDVSKSWEANLKALGRRGAPVVQERLLLHPTEIESAFDGLKRMNITARSLFPGMDGYAESMAHQAKFLLHLSLHRDCISRDD